MPSPGTIPRCLTERFTKVNEAPRKRSACQPDSGILVSGLPSKEGRIPIACRSHLFVILVGQLRRGRRERSEQTVGVTVDSGREEQRGAR